MVWHSISPVGTISVKANRLPMAENTEYIETTIGNTANNIAYTTVQKDHFFNVSGDLDGHHRFMKLPAFTVLGTPTDPGAAIDGGLGTGINGILYLKTASADISRVEGFYRNTQGIYQYIPSFQSGTAALLTASFVNVATVPKNVYGDIYLFKTSSTAESTIQYGSFKSTGTAVTALAYRYTDSAGSEFTPLRLKGDGLKIQARINSGSNATWEYRITYRAI